MLIKREYKRTNKKSIADVRDAIYYNSLGEQSVNFNCQKSAIIWPLLLEAWVWNNKFFNMFIVKWITATLFQTSWLSTCGALKCYCLIFSFIFFVENWASWLNWHIFYTFSVLYLPFMKAVLVAKHLCYLFK